MRIEDKVIEILDKCKTPYEMEVLQNAYSDYKNANDRVSMSIARKIINTLYYDSVKGEK